MLAMRRITSSRRRAISCSVYCSPALSSFMGVSDANSANADAIQINVRQPPILQRIGTAVTHWAFFEAVIEDMMAGFLGSEIHWVYTITAE